MTTQVRSSRAPVSGYRYTRRPSAVPAAAPRARSSRTRHRRTRPVRRPVASPRPRVLTLFAAIAVVFALIGVKLIDVQARDRAHFQQLGFDQRISRVTLAAERGTIFDRNGNDLAVSVSRSSIYANPKQISDPARYAALLAPITGADQATLLTNFSKKNLEFVYVARKVEKNVARQVRKLGLKGIGFLPESKRYYPAQPLAGPLLGFVGIDNDGLGGLEAGAESELAGQRGSMQVEHDARGRSLPGGEHQVRPAERGVDLLLTIDESLQYETERVLAEEVANAKAKGGMAIIADTRTGDILSMASVDGATEGVPAHSAGSVEHNRPLTDVFEPGSTAKVVTIAAALEAGIVSPSTVLQVPGRIEVDGQEYEDVHSHPTAMTVADIVRESSNVGTILIARALGSERFDAALRAFGFGQETGLHFPGEASGIILPRNQYNSTSMASMPIGSGIAVTAMQMLDVYLALANDGVARSPRLVAATIDAEGERHEKPLGATHRVVSVATARAMRTMLEGVVLSGTGTKAQVAGYRTAGKTGTARKPPYDQPPYKYVSSFVGFAPVDSPRLAAIVVLDEPNGGAYTGGQVAAPAFARILQYALAVERVPATP